MSALPRLKLRRVCRGIYNPYSSMSEYAALKAAGHGFVCIAKERELFECRKAREGMVANDWDVRIIDYGYSAIIATDASDDDEEGYTCTTPPNADVDKPVVRRIM